MSDSKSEQDDLKKYFGLPAAHWFVILTVLISALVTTYWLSNIVERYEYSGISERKQDDKVNPGYQKYSEDAIKLIAQTIKDCNAETEQKYKQTCEKPLELIEKAIAANDLAAQETMASVTNGLLWVGYVQAIAALFTVALLVWAILQTHGMLVEAEAAAGFAQDTLKVTRNSTEVELQPYFRIDVAGFKPAKMACVELSEAKVAAPAQPNTKNVIQITLSIENAGKSPAQNLWFEMGKQNFLQIDDINYTAISGYCGVYPLIAGQSAENIVIFFETEPTAPTSVKAKTFNLNEFFIRYTDFTCKDRPVHKVARCVCHWDSRRNDGRVTSYKDTENSESSEYADFLKGLS